MRLGQRRAAGNADLVPHHAGVRAAARRRCWAQGVDWPVQMSAQSGDQVRVVDRRHYDEPAAIPKRAGGSELPDLARSEISLRRFLHGLPGVDQVGADARAASLATRSIKADAKLWAIDAAISMVDLTTLEGADTPGKGKVLWGKARRPSPDGGSVPPVAAVCVYPDLVAHAKVSL